MPSPVARPRALRSHESTGERRHQIGSRASLSSLSKPFSLSQASSRRPHHHPSVHLVNPPAVILAFGLCAAVLVLLAFLPSCLFLHSLFFVLCTHPLSILHLLSLQTPSTPASTEVLALFRSILTVLRNHWCQKNPSAPTPVTRFLTSDAPSKSKTLYKADRFLAWAIYISYILLLAPSGATPVDCYTHMHTTAT